MPAAPQVVLPPAAVRFTRVDLAISTDARIAGVAGDYGYRQANFSRGQAYWTASADIAARPRAVYDEGLRVEALLGRVQRGATIAIPVWRRDLWHEPFALLDSSGDAVPWADATGSVAIVASATGLRMGGLAGPGGGELRIEIKAGCLYTVGHVLYQYDGTGGERLDVTTGDITGSFPAPAYAAGDKVELRDPYFVGLLPGGGSIRLPRTGERFGPWTLDEIVEAPR